MTTDASPLMQQKRALRTNMRALRATHADEIPQISNRIADLLTVFIKAEPAAIVAGYAAFRDEIDPAQTLARLRAAGHQTALPVVEEPGAPLLFRLYNDQTPMTRDRMGIAHPDETAPTVEPDILLVPLLAFDRTKNRLGYGGGFYDRSLAYLRARKPIIAIGIAAAFQEVASLPAGPTDAVLDYIVTENAVF